jgi:hypothetical protein
LFKEPEPEEPKEKWSDPGTFLPEAQYDVRNRTEYQYRAFDNR